jgi:hypothetical protein
MGNFLKVRARISARVKLQTVTARAHKEPAVDGPCGVEQRLSLRNGVVMRRWRWVVLICELFLFVLILVLPQVELPDFAFHQSSAPIVAKAKLCSASLVPTVTTSIQFRAVEDIREAENHHSKRMVGACAPSLLSLLCTFLC